MLIIFKIEFSYLFKTTAQKHTNLDEKVSDFSINLYDRYNYSCSIRAKNVTDVTAFKSLLTKELVKFLKCKQFFYRDYKNNYVPNHIFNNFKTKLTNIIEIAKKICLKQKVIYCIKLPNGSNFLYPQNYYVYNI